jgi:hypothetical protein
MRVLSIAAIIALCACLTNCQTTSTAPAASAASPPAVGDISNEQAEQPPFVGMTKAQALARYGEPKKQTITHEGENWIYLLNMGEVIGKAFIPFNFKPTMVRTGVLIFGPDGRVKKFKLGYADRKLGLLRKRSGGTVKHDADSEHESLQLLSDFRDELATALNSLGGKQSRGLHDNFYWNSVGEPLRRKNMPGRQFLRKVGFLPATVVDCCAAGMRTGCSLQNAGFPEASSNRLVRAQARMTFRPTG